MSGGRLLNKIEHRAPVLDVCFGQDDNEAYTAGLDWDVRRFVAQLLVGAHQPLTSKTESTYRLANKQSCLRTMLASNRFSMLGPKTY